MCKKLMLVSRQVIIVLSTLGIDKHFSLSKDTEESKLCEQHIGNNTTKYMYLCLLKKKIHSSTDEIYTVFHGSKRWIQ